jgi:hypothetical protein
LAKAWWLALIGGLIVTGPTAVFNLVEEPTRRAVTPGHPEKERAEA